MERILDLKNNFKLGARTPAFFSFVTPYMNCRSVFFLLPTVNLIRKGTIKKENIPKKQESSKNFIAFSGAGIYIYKYTLL